MIGYWSQTNLFSTKEIVYAHFDRMLELFWIEDHGSDNIYGQTRTNTWTKYMNTNAK